MITCIPRRDPRKSAVERLVFIIVALSFVVLTACAETQPRGGIGINRVQMPEWAATGRHPDFPESDFITAYGLARSASAAREEATERLEEMICRHIVTGHQPVLKDTQFAEVVTGPAAWFRAEEFGDAVVGEDVSNGFESVSVRAINRNELKLRARSLLVESGSALRATPMPPSGLGPIERRMEMWGDYFLKAVRVVALELLAENTLNRTVFEKLEEAVLALWELPSLMTVSQQGGNQVVKIRGGAPDQLHIWASYRGKPVAGVPLRWGPARGFAGSVEGDREFDERGGASARVLHLQPNGNEWGYVAASLDLDSFMGRRTGVSMTVWLWQLKLPSVNNGELVLDVVEEVDGASENVDTLFADEIEKWAKSRGLAVSRGEPSELELPYRVKLSGRLNVVAATDNGVPMAYASGTLKLTNMDGGEPLFSYVVGVRKLGQEGNSESALKMIARKDGAADAMMEVVPRIVAALPGKSDLIRERE